MRRMTGVTRIALEQTAGGWIAEIEAAGGVRSLHAPSFGGLLIAIGRAHREMTEGTDPTPRRTTAR